jgi:zinc protease
MTSRPAGRVLGALFLLSAVADVPGGHATDLHEQRLANGLRIVLAADPAESQVAVSASFDAGSRNETPATLGVARRTAEAVAARLPGFEASVNQERAVLSRSGAPADLPRMLDSLAALMRDPCGAMTARDRAAGSPTVPGPPVSEADAELLRLSYASFSYAHPTVSTPENRDRAGQFLCRHYAPNTLALAVAGRFDAETVQSLSRKLFSALRKRRPPAAVAAATRPPTAERRKELRDPTLAAPRISFSYVTVPANHPDWYALNILADVIGNGEDSRMLRALVASGLAARFLEGMTENRAPSLLRMRTDLPRKDADPRPVEEALDRELARVRDEPITPAELLSAQNAERRAAGESRKTPLDVANTLSRFVTYFDDARRLDEELRRLLAVTVADVQRVARRYLVKENRAVVVVLP